MIEPDYKQLYESERRRRKELQTKVDNLKNAILILIEDDIHNMVEIYRE